LISDRFLDLFRMRLIKRFVAIFPSFMGLPVPNSSDWIA
jgi:hypothetical protein